MGIHVLCEKPMALTIEECDRMVSSCKKNNVKLQAGFMKRFNIGLKKIKDIISNGELGTVAYVHVHWTMPSAMPRPPMPKGVKRVPQQWVGGGFMADGPHYIDQFRWWIGDIKSVCGEYRPMEKGPFGVFRDVAVAAFSFENNAVGIFHCGGGYCDPRTGSLYEHGEIDGINSSIRWVVPAFSSYELPEIHMMTGVSDSLVPIHPPVSTNPREYFQFYRQMDAFIDCINNDTQPLVTGEDGRAATEVVLAYYQSVDERKTVKLPLKRSPDLPQIMENLASRGNN
jgi:myo-inositol 2-dehydrogenase/D-chiro-inositol 1-dehydrogenase/scyllo-inositol 2-dehydrogenase (NAD+)